jgi:hypothetical protein
VANKKIFMNKKEKEQKAYGFWNWGTGLAIAITVGVLGIVFLVYRAQSMSAELVTEDYYAEELKFQDEINARTNANTLSDSVRISIEGNTVIVAFPKECVGQSIKGKLYFYSPVASLQDYTIPLAIDAHGLQAIPAQKIASGSYRVKIHWTMQNKPYYTDVPFKMP